MPDSNARRDKALESIARELGNIAHEFKRANERLAQIERNTRRTTFTNYPADVSTERPDAFDVPQLPQPGVTGPPEAEHQPAGPFVRSSHPYFKRESDGSGSGSDSKARPDDNEPDPSDIGPYRG